MDDPLHQMMAHHIFLGKIVEGDSFHGLQHIGRFQQSAPARVG